MDFVKLRTNYYRDQAIMRAGEAAEVLFVRAMAHCGDHETRGIISREVLPFLTPTRGAARAASLVREGLWEVIAEGWRFRSWDKHQIAQADLEERRAANRRRQASYRARNGVTDGARHGVSNASVTGSEVEEEVEEDTRVTGVSPSLAATRSADGLTDEHLETIRKRLGSASVTYARQVAAEVLARAQATVANPLRYVLAAVDAEPDRYRPTPGPPKAGDCCPISGHESYPANHCGACRSEEIATPGGTR